MSFKHKTALSEYSNSNRVVYKNSCIAIATELFFKEDKMKKTKVLQCILMFNWY
jgi:hypothetical protein